MVRFTLFGVPVEIQPWYWLGIAFFGGLTDAKTPEAMKAMLIFMFAGTVSILVHEFGHALTGRRLGGGHANIVLHAFGGLAYNRGGHFNRQQEFWRVAMGPGAGFLLLAAIILILVIAFGPADAGAMTGLALFGKGGGVSKATADFFDAHLPLWWLVRSFLQVNFWWGVINLLPVLPLDGGRITEVFVRPKSKVYQIGIVAAAITAIVGLLLFKRYYTALLFGYFAYTNYQALQELHGHRR